jgi:hypothetical protein
MQSKRAEHVSREQAKNWEAAMEVCYPTITPKEQAESESGGVRTPF